MKAYWLNIFFETQWMLWLLILLPIIFYYDFRWTKNRPGIRYSATLLLPQVESWRIRLYKWSNGLKCLAASCFIIALAKPVLPLTEEYVEADSIDIAMAIDLSSSMLAQDFQPNRLEASKEVANKFIQNRPYDLFTLVVFAAESYTLSPLTTDKGILNNQINNMQCGLLEDGTAIGMGLANAINRLKEGRSKSKVVILLTDGVNNAGYIQPRTAANIAKELDIKIYSIGVGSVGEALSPVSRRADGQYIYGYTQVEIDEALLNEISELTGGKYYRATDIGELEDIYEEIDQLEKTKVEITTIRTYEEQFRWMVYLGTLFLFFELVIRQIWIKRLP
jgi:Ca-activated chloride channel family protein